MCSNKIKLQMFIENCQNFELKITIQIRKNTKCIRLTQKIEIQTEVI